MALRKVDVEIVVPLSQHGWEVDDLIAALASARDQLHGARVSVIDGTEGCAEDVVRDLIPEKYLTYDPVIGPRTRNVCLYQGLAGAKAQWISYLEPGSVWRRDHLYRMGTMLKRVDVDVAFSGNHVSFDSWDDIPVVLRSRNVIPTHAVVHRLDAYRELMQGWPREELFGDWNLWVQMADRGAWFGHDPQRTAWRTRPTPEAAAILGIRQPSTDDLFVGDDYIKLGAADAAIENGVSEAA